MNHFEEEICFGFISRPIKNKIIPINQDINCFMTELGATELTMRILMEKRNKRLITITNHGFLDINKF